MNFIKKLLKYLLLLLFVVFLLGFLLSYLLSYVGSGNYPIRYGEEIERVAQEEKLDPRLIAAIIKTESDFRSEVIASDGGMGLMQLMPETAQEMCQAFGLTYQKDLMLDPATNIKLGTHYLSSLIQKYQNRHLATAAYNVGQRKVDGWLKDGTITWELSSMDKIPVPITRRYVKKVDKAYQIYSVFYSDHLPKETASMNAFALAWDHLVKAARWSINKVK